MKRDIFISHKTDDASIAGVVKDHLLAWGINLNRIFLSSDVESALRVGEDLDHELLRALREAKLMLFIYTTREADWNWCTFEIGAAVRDRTGART